MIQATSPCELSPGGYADSPHSASFSQSELDDIIIDEILSLESEQQNREAGGSTGGNGHQHHTGQSVYGSTNSKPDVGSVWLFLLLLLAKIFSLFGGVYVLPWYTNRG